MIVDESQKQILIVDRDVATIEPLREQLKQAGFLVLTARRLQTMRLIILSDLAGEQDVVSGLNTGADDYITKPFSLREAVARIRAVLRTRPPGSNGALNFEHLMLNTATNKQILSFESRIRNIEPRRWRVTSSDTWEKVMMDRYPPTLRLRTVFISDIHLGFKGCSADLLLDFLHHVEMDTLFLVGDVIDVWSMQRSMFWPQPHNNVLRAILGKAKRGTKVIFVPGNHDEVFREFDSVVK